MATPEMVALRRLQFTANRIESKVDFLVRSMLQSQKQEVIVSQELDDLKAEVQETKGVSESAVALINGISARIQAAIDAGGKPEDFVAMKAELDASNAALAAAVAANS